MNISLHKRNVRGSTKRWARQTKWLALVAAALLLSPAAQAQISGTKTVCSSGCDYTTVGGAVSDLASKGINGATTISIAKGSYNETVTVSGISGLSSSNTLTFKGAGTSRNDVRIYYGSANYVVQLNKVSYVSIENLTIENTSSNSSTTGLYLNNATYCTIKNVRMLGMVTSSGISNNSVMRMDYSSDNTIQDNELRGGGYMALDMQSSYSNNDRNTFKNNTFKRFCYYSTYIYYGDKNVWTGNLIDSAAYTYGYGIQSYYETNSKYIGNTMNNLYYGGGLFYHGTTGTSFEFRNNFVNGTSSYSYYGLYLQGYANAEITNNMINLSSSNAQYGMMLYPYNSSATWKFYHNTIHMASANNYNMYIYGYYKPLLDIRNNILSRSGNGAMYYYSMGSTAGMNPNTIIDWNAYQRTGGNFATIDNITYSTLAAFQAGIKKGLNDYTTTVPYKSSTDLHLDQNSVAPYAKALSSITTDIDGDARKCSLFVTAGADESNYSGNLHLQKPSTPKFTGPSTGVDGVALSYMNGGTVGPFVYLWYVDNKLQKDSAHLKVAMTTGTHKVKLVAKNCGGEDSSVLTVVIKDPASTPTSDFISDVNIISAGDTVKFSDGSTGDPSTYSWSITPGTALDNNNNVVASYNVVYGSLTSSDPWIQFPYAGKYKICLTTSNKKGTGTTECKSAYIEVKPVYNMGKVATITDTAATFYDDGGKNGNQGFKSGKTKLLIDPCASDVWLTFSMFDQMCGYNYLRVYDGDQEDPSKLLHTKCTGASPYYPSSTGFTGGTSYPYCPSSSTSCMPSLSSSSKPDTFHAKSGRMLIVQDINYGYPQYNYGKGFEAHFWSKAKAMSVPTAKFSSLDSICTNGVLKFTNQSSGTNVKYFWDLDGDLDAFESTSETTASWPFFTDGQVTVTLIAQNCGGSDTFQKTITVFNPATPSTAFVADNTNPTLNDVVFFSTDMKECVDNYKWTITSASGKGIANFVNGTKSTSPNPQVMFTDTGCYSVELYTENSSGDDNLKLNCYIKVKNPYCVPTVTTMSGDLGISKVSFNTIHNSSDQGKTGYSNFAAVQSLGTTVEIGVTYKLTIERTTNKNKATRTVWIDWNGDGDFNDSGEKIGTEANAQTLSWSTDITIPSTAKTGATIMRISVDLGSQTPTPCGPNKFGEVEDYRLYIRPDLTKPVITLIGSDTVVIEQGMTYSDSGATAMDNLDGDISAQITVTEPASGFNMIPGTYTYRYNVTDAANNDAVTVKRVVIVTPDATAPELVVMKPDSIMLQVFSTFTPPAIISANDLVDGDLSGAVQIVNNVKNNEVGDYTVTYTVSDVSKNKTSVTRYVKVVDTIMPTITLVGSSTVFTEVGSSYTDSGVVVKDNYYSEADLRNNLTMQSNVDINNPGVYTVVYVLKDPFTGKTVSVSRTVEVRDTQNPTVALKGNVTDVIDVFTTYNDLGVTATDNYDNNPSVTVTGSYYTAFPDGQATKLGTYTIIYTVADESGNTATTTRNVKVVDRVAPTATLIGNGYVSVCRWATYNDEGVSIKDNYDSTSNLTITKEGTYFFTETNVEGIYNFRYKVVDQSGNIGYSEYRYIMVRNPYQSPCTTATSVGEQIGLDKLVNVYPNPNQGKFTVEANIAATEQVRITVTNLLGQEIAVISNGALSTHTFSVDLSNQKAGVYMLNVTTDKQTVTKRIVVTK